MPPKNSAKPSVLFINRVYPPQRGATGRVLRELAREMARQGWRVRVVCAGKENFRQMDGGVSVIRVKTAVRPRSAMTAARVMFALFRAALKQPKPDLVVTLSDPPMLATLGHVLKKRWHCPHLHWCHDLYPDLLPGLEHKTRPELLRFLNHVAHKSLKGADRIIVIGRCMAAKMMEKKISPGRVTVIPNWADTSLPDVKIPKTSRRKRISKVRAARAFADLYKDDSPKFRILYAGNIGRAHPLQSILEAAEFLKDDHPEIEFVFVGEGAGHERIAKERAKRGLNNIRLMPFQPAARLREVLESGDVHLVSMREELSGMLVPCKLYSAFAVHRPCIFIGPANSEAARVILDFKAGAVIPQKSAAMLAQTIKHYRTDSEMWFSAQEGAAEAGRVFTPKDSIEAWIKRAQKTIDERDV